MSELRQVDVPPFILLEHERAPEAEATDHTHAIGWLIGEQGQDRAVFCELELAIALLLGLWLVQPTVLVQGGDASALCILPADPIRIQRLVPLENNQCQEQPRQKHDHVDLSSRCWDSA